MRLNIRTKIIFISFTLCFLCVSSTSGFKNVSLGGFYKASNSKDDRLEFEILITSQISERIHINNNWTATKIAGICTGMGTYSKPYIIKDMVINAKSSGNGILIENSNDYFIIKNCSLYNSGTRLLDSGIKLNNVSNSKLIENYCLNNFMGINLVKSHNNSITGNMVNSGNTMGILVNQSNLNHILLNIIGNNTGAMMGTGITLVDSNDTRIIGNVVQNNNLGIDLSVSSDNIISGNKINFNFYGITSYYSNNNKISGNDIENNLQEAIYLDRSDFNNISRNIVKRNSGYGIILSQSNYNLISENDVSENILLGIGIDLNSIYNTIQENIVKGNNDGIYMHYSDHINIHNNSISYNLFGIKIVFCSDNNISENIINENEHFGIYMSGTIFNAIIGNIINKNIDYGIFLNQSNFNKVSSNTIIDNGICITEENCHDNIFNNNTGCDYGKVVDGGAPMEAIIFTLIGVIMLGLVIILLISQKRKKLESK